MKAARSELVGQLADAAQSRLAELETEMEGLVSQRSALDIQIGGLNEEATQLRGLLSVYESPLAARSVPTVDRTRVSASLADQVVELLAVAGHPMHYREVERQMRLKGLYSGGGKDPANALLATYFNDPRLYRPARGTYATKTAGSDRSVGTKGLRKGGRRGN